MKTEKSNPRISVIIPVCNAESFLAEALEDISNQTEGRFEVICVNDGSTDGSEKILQQFCSSWFRRIF